MLKHISAEILDLKCPDQALNEIEIDKLLHENLNLLDKKIIVLDDDPTGVQTVHSVFVYTDWSKKSFFDGFMDSSKLFYILTNSRSFTADQTRDAHIEIARNISAISQKTGKDFILMSRSDSTLRGHYPLETLTLKNQIEKLTSIEYHGEIIFPFFKEGGRFTIDNIHYVKEGNMLVPAGDTEFAKDKSFGYTNSDLSEWCEEKTEGEYKSKDTICISLNSLRSLNIDSITRQLINVKGFNKVIVNAIDYADVKVFCIAYLKALKAGKQFIFRCAASIVKILGGIPDRPLLTGEDLKINNIKSGGIIIIGSHVNRTSQQLNELLNSSLSMEFIEFNQHLVIEDSELGLETERVSKLADKCIKEGTTAVIYTRRERFDLNTSNKDSQLRISVQISDAITGIVTKLTSRPKFIIAKGGITSSDIGVKALKVKKASVMGQIKPGIPVWRTDDESKFPGIPFIIFPGNVGEVTTLREIVEELI